MVRTSRIEEQEPLSPEQLEELTKILEARRKQLASAEEQSLEADREEGTLRHADEVDLASAEWDVAVGHRMRGRDSALLRKISKSLLAIKEGTYDICDSCGNYIGYKRLLARPEASLCIDCKEEEERVERSYMKRAPIDNPFSFD